MGMKTLKLTESTAKPIKGNQNSEGKKKVPKSI